MKTAYFHALLLLCFCLTIGGCKNQQKITPLFESRTIGELRNNRPAEFTFSLDPVDVDEVGDELKIIPLVGDIFRTVAHSVADIFIIGAGGDFDIDLDPIVVEFPELADIDLDYFDSIDLEGLYLKIKKGGKKSNFKFLNKLKIYIEFDYEEVDENGRSYMKTKRLLALSYAKNRDSLGCNQRCLWMVAQDIEWKDILKNNYSLKIIPVISVKSAPKRDLAITGHVKINTIFNLPF